MTSDLHVGLGVGFALGAAVAYQIGYEKAPRGQIIVEDSGIIEPLE